MSILEFCKHTEDKMAERNEVNEPSATISFDRSGTEFIFTGSLVQEVVEFVLVQGFTLEDIKEGGSHCLAGKKS